MSQLFFRDLIMCIADSWLQVFTHSLKLIIFSFAISGRGGSAGAKFRIALGLPVGAVINCADNTGEFLS